MNDFQLKYLVRTVECGSMTKCASVSNTTYQNVVYQINNLEKEFGVKLLNRDRNGCSLTSDGRYVYKFAKNTIENYERTKQTLLHSAEIRIAVDIRYIHPKLITLLDLDSPYEFSLIPAPYNKLIELVERGDADCYMGYKREHSKSVYYKHIAQDMVAVGMVDQNELSNRDTIEYSDFNDTTIHLGQFQWDRRDIIVESIKRASPSCAIKHETAMSLALAEIRSNKAVALLPFWYGNIIGENRRIIPLKNEQISFGIYYTNKEKVSGFISMLEKKFQAD